jgi:hypothetical protein
VATKEPQQEKDVVYEPGGRKLHSVEEMSDEALAAAYGDGTKFRAHGVSYSTDQSIGFWLKGAQKELKKRGKLDLIKEYLPVYFDPSRTPAIFGPGAPMVSQGVIERAIAPRALKSGS